MKKLKFRTRLYLGFGVILLFNSIIALFAIRLAREISNDTSIIYQHPLTVSNSVRDINIYIGSIQRAMKDVVLAENQQQIERSVQLISQYQDNVQQAFNVVFDRFLGDKEIPKETFEAFQKWEPIRTEIFELKLAGNDVEASALSTGKEAEYVAMLFEKTKIMTDFAQNKANKVYDEIKRAERSNMIIIITMFILSLILSLWFALFISGSVSKPIHDFILQIERLYKREKTYLPKNSTEQEVFDVVVKELSDAYTRLESFNFELEQKVKNRTKELQQSQEQLITQNEEFSSLNKEYLKQNIDLKKAIQKAEESDRLKSAFLANMSHEIRTPMNGILGFTGLLQQDNLTKEEKAKYIEIINNSGNQLLTIISDIIDISKIEAGQVNLTIEDENINKLLDKLESQFKVELVNKRKRNIQLIMKKGLEDSECTIKVDGVRLNQVLMNLIGNAIKFTNEGVIEFGYRVHEKHRLLFYVEDTGSGVSLTDQKIIFERFMQAENTTKKNIGGTGLGLSISKGLITLMGGKIWMDSVPGRGSTFFFTIPFKQAEHKEGNNILSMRKTPNYDWADKTILVVDDMDVVYYYVSEILKETRARLIHVKTGLDAIEAALSNNNIDIILMDIQLPDVDGLEVTRKIKSKRDIPVIAQTAYAMPDDREKALAAGCDDYIAKPLNKKELLQLIDKNLS